MQVTINKEAHRITNSGRRGRLGLARRAGTWAAACLVSALMVAASAPHATAQTTQLRDVAVTDAVEEALASNLGVYAPHIAVSSYDGVVTLWGTVDSHRDRQLIEQTAAGVAGVLAVDSRIVVRARVPMRLLSRSADAEIQQDVQAALASSWRIDSRRIGVHVYRSQVTLSGVVNSEQERTLAIMLAMVPGARVVQAENLEVVDWAAYGRERMVNLYPPVRVYPSDSQIEHTIRQAFELTAAVPQGRVGVESHNGRVVLYGTVASHESRAAAQNIARQTAGVASVVNRIQVRPAPAVTDASIERRIATGLARNEHLIAYEVDVSVHDGVATLWGDVPTAFERGQAAQVASRVSGVRRVINRITVEIG